MGIVLGDNIDYKGKKPLDSRMLFDTIADMKAYSENYLPDITLAFNKEDSKMYVFNRENDVDTTTGKWRIFESDGGDIAVEDLTNYNYLTNRVEEHRMVLKWNSSTNKWDKLPEDCTQDQNALTLDFNTFEKGAKYWFDSCIVTNGHPAMLNLDGGGKVHGVLEVIESYSYNSSPTSTQGIIFQRFTTTNVGRMIQFTRRKAFGHNGTWSNWTMEQTSRQSVNRGKTYAFFGGSVCYNWNPFPNDDTGYSNEEILGASSIRKRAISGAGWVAGNKIDNQITTELAEANPADVWVFWSSTNDHTAQAPIGDLDHKSDTTTVIGAMCNAIERVRTAKPTANILMTTPIRRFNNESGWNPYYDDGTTIPFYKYAEAVYTVANYYGIPVFDLWNNSGIDIKNYTTYMSDTIHPKASGYALFSRELCKFCANGHNGNSMPVIQDGGTESVYLTQDEYDALTQEEQEDETKDYYIISNETAVPSERIIFRDLDDVAIVNPEEGDVVRYNSTTEKWENKEIADINADYTLSEYSLGKAIAPTDYGARKGGVGNEWETFHMYPMFKGDTIKVVNSLAVQNPWRLMVVYDANKDFVASFGGNSKTYTFANDGYVTFITCTTSSSTPTVQITRAHKIDYSVNLQENALNQSVERNVLVDISAYLQPNNYLKTDNTLVSFTGRYSYKDIPLQKGDILQVYLGTGPSVSGATQSLIVRNDSTIVVTGQSMSQLYATENCTYSCCWDNANVKTAYVRVYRPQATTIGTLITNLENTKADKESITPIKRAAIGDSITAGNEGNTGNSYSRTAARLVGERVKLQNLGYWGHTMKQSLATTAYNAISAGTNIITVNFGSNDIFVLGSSQWGDVDEVIAKPRADLADNVSSLESLRLFIEKCRENKPEATIYYITAIKRGADETHMAFNNKVIALCNHYSIQVLDAYHECSIRQSDTIYKRDGIHPNDAGCLVYGRWLANKINFL